MSVFIAMCMFSLSMSISPGPVNLITLSTGVNHGFKKAIPFVSGATIGFTLLLVLVGLGLASLAEQNQLLFHWLGYAGAGFICYMGYKVATSKPEIEVKSQDLPSFYQGFLLQWLNPKAWIACLSGVSAFNLADSNTMLALFVSLYFAICYVSMASWALVGDRINRLLTSPRHLRVFNAVMGGGLIGVAFYLIFLQLNNL